MNVLKEEQDEGKCKFDKINISFDECSIDINHDSNSFEDF